MNGELDDVAYVPHATFGMHVPQEVPNVPAEILMPRNTWENKAAYDKKANELAQLFVNNFGKIC